SPKRAWPADRLTLRWHPSRRLARPDQRWGNSDRGWVMVSPFPSANVLEWFFLLAGGDPPPAKDRRRLNPLMGNGQGVAVRFLGGACGLLGDSCGRPERPRRDADYALEVTGELVLVPEAGARGDLRQGEVVASLPELLRPFDAAGDDVLVRG